MTQITGQPKFELFAETETRFFLKAIDAQVEFFTDGSDAVAHLVIHQGDSRKRCTVSYWGRDDYLVAINYGRKGSSLHGGDLADGGSSASEIVDRIRDLDWKGVLVHSHRRATTGSTAVARRAGM